MAKGAGHRITFCVPGDHDGQVCRLDAPRSLIQTASRYRAEPTVELLRREEDGNFRPWHAKMLALRADAYSALMIGSSNFTSAGMGVTPHRHAEANLLTLVDRVAFARASGQLEAIWPELEVVDDPDEAEWRGPQPEDEDEQDPVATLPAGFLAALYRAGERRQIALRLDPAHLPEDWRVHACGQDPRELLTDAAWLESGRPNEIVLEWGAPQPPDRVLVRWADGEAFLPLNVEDSRSLPPPAKLEEMSADEMLRILAATDPSAAFRAWARRQRTSEHFDEELDSIYRKFKSSFPGALRRELGMVGRVRRRVPPSPRSHASGYDLRRLRTLRPVCGTSDPAGGASNLWRLTVRRPQRKRSRAWAANQFEKMRRRPVSSRRGLVPTRVAADGSNASAGLRCPRADLRRSFFWFLTQMYARFWVVEGPPCSGRGSGCRSWRS